MSLAVSTLSALAGTLMAMGRCKQRYHRALFLGWLLPAVGVLNVMIIFMAVWPADELEALKKSPGCPTLGFSRCSSDAGLKPRSL